MVTIECSPLHQACEKFSVEFGDVEISFELLTRCAFYLGGWSAWGYFPGFVGFF